MPGGPIVHLAFSNGVPFCNCSSNVVMMHPRDAVIVDGLIRNPPVGLRGCSKCVFVFNQWRERYPHQSIGKRQSDEDKWLTRAKVHDAQTSKSEVEFFRELRRMPDNMTD
jgi:hypothetical protein